MTLAAPHSEAETPRAEHFLLHGVSWSLYDNLLREIGGRRVFVTYDRGELELMSPSNPHEAYKKTLARLIEAATEELGLPLSSCGSVTLRRKDLGQGLEPDESYYIQNEPAMRAPRELDLSKDPPPDLVVEMDYTHRTLDRDAIYAALGVPEVWRFNLERLEFLGLVRGNYQPMEQSVALPRVPRAQVERFLKMRQTQSETEVVKAWRMWIRAYATK